MSTIAGYIGAESEGHASNMALTLRHRRKRTQHLATSGHCSLVVNAKGDGPTDSIYRAPSGELVVIDGEVFGLEAQPEDRGLGQAELFYRAFKREGHALLARIRGAFSVALWEPERRTLSLITDPYGLRALYYTKRGQAFAFASRVRGILSGFDGTPEIDQSGLSDFVLLGMPMQERTLFEGIELVPAASVLTFRDGSLHVQRYHELCYGRTDDSPRSLPDATDQLYEAFLSAGAEQMGADRTYHVPLSGGLDSRIVAALAKRFAKKVSTFSMGDRDSLDLKIAPSVARSLTLRNQAWIISPEEWLDSVQDSVYLTDGMYNPMDAQIMSVARRLRDPQAITLDGTSSLDGYFRFFDPLLSRIFPGYACERQHAARVAPDALVDSAGNLTFAPLANSDFVGRALAHVKTSLEDMLWAIPEASRKTPFDAMDHMDQLHRVRRFNMMGTVLLREVNEVRHPFFDPRVTSVIRSLRSEHRSREKRVLGQVLSRLSLAAARVPYERTGMRADASTLDHTVRYAKLAAQKTVHWFLGGPSKRVTPVIDYRRWCREQPLIQTFVRDTLGPHSESSALLGRSTLNAVVSDCLSPQGSGTTTFLVGRLLSYELWHRMFVRGDEGQSLAAE